MPLDTKLKGNDLFDKLEREEEHPVKKFDVKKNKTLDTIIRAFEKALKLDWENIRNAGEYDDYNKLNLLLRNNSFHASDIEQFSLLLPNYQEKRIFSNIAGFYLSCCINRCIENKVILLTHLLERDIYFIGARNKNKTIVIKGGGGNCLGYSLNGGRIIVYGNAGNYAGEFMAKGRLYIHGDCGDSLGKIMRGGVIQLKGNAGAFVGDEMGGGKIYLSGDYESLGNDYDPMTGGNIYHKRKLIVKDGRLVK